MDRSTLRLFFCIAACLTLAGWPSTSSAAEVTRGPYLQQLGEQSVVVVWRTDQPTDSRVVYGCHPDSLVQSVVQSGLTTEHEVELSGLAPGTRQHYAVGSSAEILAGGDAQHYFDTAPVRGTAVPTRVWILGDSGMGNQAAVDVREAYYALYGDAHADVWLMLGDNAYPQGTDDQYQAHLFEIYPDTLANSPLWPTVGNHDLPDAGAGTWPYFDLFSLPQDSSQTENYYSFDFANVHFVSIDSTTWPSGSLPGSDLLAWLEDDLQATEQSWTVVYFHHPPYTDSAHDSDNPADSNGRMGQMREQVLPVLEAHGVDLVLSGHGHSYERSYLIHGHYGTSDTFVETMKVDDGDGSEAGDGPYAADGNGTVYVVAGSSSLTSGGDFQHPAMYEGQNTLGSVVLDVGGNRLDARFVTDGGVVADAFTLVSGDCDDDNVCDPGEDCFVCPGDCAAASGAQCGNGLCEAGDGEDCLSCPDDCRGKQNGSPRNRFCCGDGDGTNPASCDDARCSENGYRFTDLPAAAACCGDAVCGGTEDGSSCGVDCAPGNTECSPVGDPCASDDECCSGKCKGKSGNMDCKS